VADASYPDDLKYHPEHDWARIDGDVATFGITWYAQDRSGGQHDARRGRQDGRKDQPTPRSSR
jgi:hypothetical protein